MLFETSAHAEARLRQRGIRDEHLFTLLAYGNGTRPVGGNCEAVWLKAADRKEIAAEFGWQFVDRLRRLVAVTDSETVVTAFRNRGRKARRYFRA